MDVVTALSGLAKMASTVIAPVVILYAAVAWYGQSAKASRFTDGAFWNILITAGMIGASELLSFYAQAYSNTTAELLSSLLLLGVMIRLFLIIRARLKGDLRPYLKYKHKVDKRAA